MKSQLIYLRRISDVNPNTPGFDELSDTTEVTFVPLEAVWPSGHGDLTRRALKADVASGYTRFHAGDVLMPKITPTFEAGRVMVANIRTPAGAATTEIHVIRASHDADPRFISYTLQSEPFLQEGATTLQGVGNLRRIPPDFVKNYQIPLFALDEQQAIADFLDRETAQIDAMVAAQERLITLLEERQDAAWSLAFRELAQHASFMPLRRVISSIVDGPFGSSLTSAHYSESGTRVIRLGNVGINEFKDHDKAYIPRAYADQLAAHEARCGDVIVAGLGDEQMPIGRATVVPRIGPAIVKADCYRVRPSNRVTAEYLAWALSAPPTREQIVLHSRGSTRQRLNTAIVRNVIIPVPELGSQRLAVLTSRRHSDRTDTMITKARQSIALMKERRAALISAAVSGQIDVHSDTGDGERVLEEVTA